MHSIYDGDRLPSNKPQRVVSSNMLRLLCQVCCGEREGRI